jgi:hypothetical protein
MNGKALLGWAEIDESPEGTAELSPGRQSWVIGSKGPQSRKGRLKYSAMCSAVPSDFRGQVEMRHVASYGLT